MHILNISMYFLDKHSKIVLLRSFLKIDDCAIYFFNQISFMHHTTNNVKHYSYALVYLSLIELCKVEQIF